MSKPPQPVHVSGNGKGEERALSKGREPGRDADRKQYRSARDSTGISASHRQPIHPAMPNIPPA
ncbi:MAG TPA: hypothetical protein VHW03_04270 [Chthoniobacterales bacterium]|jgi:hypothetical protein|nr:hypothetical protein [Chthoniobacterales bacterium]